MKESHPEQDPFHWKDLWPGRLSGEGRVTTVCFTCRVPYLESVLNFLAQLHHSGQMFEALVLRGGEASKQPPQRLLFFTQLMDKRLRTMIY